MPITEKIMEGLIGPNAAVQLALPTGVDASTVLSFQLRGDITAAQLIAQVAAAVGVINQDLISQWSGVIRTTQEAYALFQAGTGGRGKTAKKAEFVRSPAVRGATSGNMLPIFSFEDTLAWSEEFLRDARQDQLDADVAEVVERWRARVIDDILTRIFTDTENAIGNSGFDVPWAKGTGSVPFIPPQNGASNSAFDTSHTHFKYVGSGAVSASTVKALLDLLVADLRHHGHTGMLYGLVSDTDVDSYFGMGKSFTQLNPAGVTVIGGNTDAPISITQGEILGMPGELFGYFTGPRGRVALHSSDRIPTGYAWVTKSYGENNVKNGVAVRTHPQHGFGMWIDPMGSQSLTVPHLEYIAVKGLHGVGINDRTNGVVGYIANGAVAYVNPDFS